MKQKVRFLQESNAIEGIEFPEADYLAAIKAPDKASAYITSILDGLTFVEENFKKKMTRNWLLELHRIVMDDLLLHGAGVYRSSWIMVGPDKPPGPSVVPYMVENWIQHFNTKSTKPLDSHFDFECIHPFIDGNGRIGRLLWAWHILRKKGTIIPILDQFPGADFRARRMAYYQAIRKYRGEHYGEIRS